MESQRLLLLFVFMFSVFMLLDAWQRDQQPPAPPAAKNEKAPKGPPSPADVPVPSEKLAAPPQATVPAERAPAAAGATIQIETDLYIAHIGSEGGDLRRLQFKKHRDIVDKTKDFVLLEVSPERTYVAQAGLIGPGLPNHRTPFKAAAERYQLAPGQESLEVRLAAPAAGGVAVEKVYRFRRDSYLIDVGFDIVNQSATALQPHAYFQMVRDGNPPVGDSAMLPTFTGVAVYTEKEKFQKLTFEEVAKAKTPYPKNSNDGWIAVLQHYFFSAWLPKEGTPREFYTRKLDENLYSAGVIVAAGTIGAGAKSSVTVPLYAGPEEQEKLEKIAPGLELTIDYGWLTVIAVPLFCVWFGMPIGLLPILMAATMWIQTLLNPEPPDPVQAKVMKIMPIVFSVFFFFFPAGLVLYWLVNNVLSIAQQWQITRMMEREAAGARKN